jgi:ATP-binding cassette subfamily B multidrug efflux pump
MFERLLNPSLDLIDRVPEGTAQGLPSRVFPFLWYFVRQMREPFAVTLALSCLGTIGNALEPWFFGQIAGEIVHLSKDSSKDWSDLWVIVGFYILIVQILVRVTYQIAARVEYRGLSAFVMMVRRQLSLYLTGHSYRYFQDDFAGRLSGKTLEMPEALRLTLYDIFNGLQYCLVGLFVAAGFFASVGWGYLGLISLYTVAGFFIVRWAAKNIGQASYVATEAMNRVRGSFIDSIANMFLVKVFARQKYEDRELCCELKKAGEALRKEQRLYVVQNWFQHTANAVFQISVLGLVLYDYAHDRISIADIMTVLGLGALVTTNSWWLMQTLVGFIGRIGEIRNSIDTIVQAHEVTDKPDAGELRVARAEIKIEKLTFAYPGRLVFENFSLDIPAGQKVGLVGPSGAGKSTLVQLLLRLFDVQGGRILIDGQNIADVTQESLRGAMSVIPQTTELMHRSIAENIRFGRLDASDAEITEAAKRAHADDFIQWLSDRDGNTGYNAQVGERGVKLSGGQRQRIALARAILRAAPILILDEATSALDSESERLIQKSLESLMEGKTVLAIAHRLSTLSVMDRLIVMENGKIVEDGTHADLVARGGLYARLWALQSEGFIGTGILKETL